MLQSRVFLVALTKEATLSYFNHKKQDAIVSNCSQGNLRKERPRVAAGQAAAAAATNKNE